MKFRKSFIACSAAISLAFSAGYAIATDTSSPSTNSKASPIPGSSLSTVSEVVEAFDENTFKKTVEEKLRAQVYAVVPFDGHDLYSVFTTKGTFTIDRDVELAFKGK
ncbi:hypothetical protein OCT63_19500 [Vibrio sp. RW]|uniref:hypothetical protein n=1 Tax=Vibrio sp. RW TaxID=2998833 RepID=UPI0022CDA724|nr:hypothetical protein [Vibrio sp. RW]MDA0146415.1 hypothetical protein [Vibrio sp. RW]